MAPACLSGCICKIGRHGQVLGLQDEAFGPRLRRSDLLRHATCIADCCTGVIRYRSHPCFSFFWAESSVKCHKTWTFVAILS
jgi:hypothetical protein